MIEELSADQVEKKIDLVSAEKAKKDAEEAFFVKGEAQRVAAEARAAAENATEAEKKAVLAWEKAEEVAAEVELNEANKAAPELDPYGERAISLRIPLNAHEHHAITEAAKITNRSKSALIRHAVVEFYKNLEAKNER